MSVFLMAKRETSLSLQGYKNKHNRGNWSELVSEAIEKV